VSQCVLDAGALIALERNDRTMWAALKLAARTGDDVLVPSTVLAQVWRGTTAQAQLARALQQCALARFDPLAKEVGRLCAKTGTRDICDAHVALVAASGAQALYTSDPDDMRLLLRAAGKHRVVIVRC
jgi:predicted nucleic acid-binding protein